jgi:hypothetical protein
MGMTLVELMVSLCILAIVMVAVVGIFGAQYRNMGRDHGIKEATREGQISFEFLRLDLMEAGWSVKPEMSFYFEDGGTGRSDKIYINDTAMIDIDEDEHMDQLISEDCPGCSRITEGSGTSSATVNDLDVNGDGKNDFRGAAYQFVISDDGLSKVAKINTVSGNQLNLEVELGGSRVAPAVYYCVDDGNADCHSASSTEPLWVLRRSDRSSGGRQVVAENVVDLQVAYRDADGEYWYGEAGCEGTGTGPGKCQMSPFDPRSIDLVRLTLVVRSRHQSRDLLGDPRYCRPAVENRAAGVGADECGRVYRLFSMMIHPRNN